MDAYVTGLANENQVNRQIKLLCLLLYLLTLVLTLGIFLPICTSDFGLDLNVASRNL